MGLKVFTTDFQNISNQEFFRLDFGYRHFFDKQNAVIYNFDKYTLLKYILKEIQSNKIPKGELKDEEILVDLGNIKRRYNYLINLEKVNEIGSDKNILQNGDIVIPKMQPQMGNIFLNLKHERYIASTELLEYTINTEYNPVFIYYLIVSKKFLTSLKKLESGKTHRRVKSEDLLKIKIPLISKAEQDRIVAAIEPIENRIKKLKSQMRAPQKIINEVFTREFEFDENQLFEFGKGMTAGTQIAPSKKLRVFKTDFENLARSSTLRFSTRFHNPPMKKLMDFLDSMETLQVKDVVESYEQGIQPEYNADGEIPVVKIANLKNNFIDFTESEYITEEYYNNLNEIKKLKKGDIIICATGKISLGKIDYYDYKHDSITTVDNYILRLNENYNPLFFTYFFRSILGCFQVERDYTGATNQIHLYWDQISNFKIPDIPLDRQEKIVDEIKSELDKQEAMKSRIESARNEIDKIIEKAVG